MTDTFSPARARAEAIFKVIPTTPETRASAMAEYKSKQAAQLENMAQLRALRMAKGKR
jgi:hypothetical protein